MELLRAARPLLTRPDLWPTAIGAYRDLIPTDWWRHRPYLPVPDRTWLGFRLTTAYGPHRPPAPELSDDLVLWLEWLRQWNRDGRARTL